MSIRFNHRTGLIESIGNSGLTIYDSGETDSFTISHDGTDILLESSSNASNVILQVTGDLPFTTGEFQVAADINVTGNIDFNASNGPRILNEGATATNPTLIPSDADSTSGIGSSTSGTVSMVAGGTNVAAWNSTTHTILTNTYINQPGAGPGLQIGDGDMADQDVLLRLNSDAPFGFIQEGDGGTAYTAFKAFTNDDFTIQNSTGTDVFTFTVSSGNLDVPTTIRRPGAEPFSINSLLSVNSIVLFSSAAPSSGCFGF